MHSRYVVACAHNRNTGVGFDHVHPELCPDRIITQNPPHRPCRFLYRTTFPFTRSTLLPTLGSVPHLKPAPKPTRIGLLSP